MGVACSKHDATVDPYGDPMSGGTAATTQPSNNCFRACAGIDPAVDPRMDSCRADAIDPVMYDLCRKSLNMTLQDEETKMKQMQEQSQQESAPPVSSPSKANTATSSYSSSGGASPPMSHKQKQLRLQQLQQQRQRVGQYHLLYKNQTKAAAAAAASSNDNQTTTSSPTTTGSSSANNNNSNTAKNNNNNTAAATAEDSLDDISTVPSTSPYSTRLIVRRRPIAAAEEGTHGTHLYAIRYPPDDVAPNNKIGSGTSSESHRVQEQAPSYYKQRESRGSSHHHGSSKKRNHHHNNLDPATEPIPEPLRPSPTAHVLPTEGLTDFFQPSRMKQQQQQSSSNKTTRQTTIQEWVTVSEEHCIYVVDVGLTPAQCDKIVAVTEQVCRGQYAAYTYAKQTLGCREFPVLAQACAPPVQSVVQAILGLPTSKNGRKDGTAAPNLQLDDREPHLVKYDVTKKERQKLDMHTDKSEWTFLIALSNGCGLDYDGGGTYFECLNATIHVQRGHALIFPGKLRHCGQRITRGLRYLLVGFLVDKALMVSNNNNNGGTTSSSVTIKAGSRDSSDSEEDKKSNNSTTLPVSAKSLTTGIPTVVSA